MRVICLSKVIRCELMKILLLGSTGLLGRQIYQVFKREHFSVVGVARTNADYNFDMRNRIELTKCFIEVKPDIVINSVAIVDLAYCEMNPLVAYQVNTQLVAYVVELSKQYNSYLIQISTDHYYNDKNILHDETYPVCLLNEYARTKYWGECLAAAYNDSLIVRTNIVGFKDYKDNPTFLDWVLRSLLCNTHMTLFDDFYTSSINARQLALILLDLLKIKPKGILNIASSEIKNKKDFVIGIAKCLGISNPNYTVGSVKSLNNIITRAQFLGLDVRKAEALLGYKMPEFQDVLESIKEDYRSM